MALEREQPYLGCAGDACSADLRRLGLGDGVPGRHLDGVARHPCADPLCPLVQQRRLLQVG